MTVGFETWYPKTADTVFIVKNIARGGKTIRIFNYPISNGAQRDLLAIPYVSEADIRHSLLKGELYIKILANEIEVTRTNIDLLQFDPTQKAFLENAGVNAGLSADGYSGGGVNYLWRNEIELVGPKNNSNVNFTTPGLEKFVNTTFDSNEFRIAVYHNGRKLIQNVDFICVESGGVGTGYDTIRLISLIPAMSSKLVADYVISA